MCRSGFLRPVVWGLLIAFFPFCLAAQQSVGLSGQVISSGGAPVPNATVHVLNSGIFVLTGDNGYFTTDYALKGHYQLECSAVGYATQVVEVDYSNDQTNVVITLRPAVQQLDVVVVTAEKREVVAQRLPLSVSVLSASKVDQYTIRNTRDLTGIAPNLYLTHSGDERNVTGIRGVVTTSYTPAVTTYVDGVNQFSLDTYIASLFDIKRIEILRGPQGTLYGRNALGGVINIITEQPLNELQGSIGFGFGNYGSQTYNAALRFPLVKDRLYLGVASEWQARDGYFTNVYDQTSFDRQQKLLSNLYLKYRPGNNWNLTLNFKRQDLRNQGPFPLVQTQGSLEEAFVDPYQLSQDAVGQMRDRTSNASLVMRHDGAKVLFTSQTAFQSNYRYYRNPLDGDFSTLNIVTIANDFGKKWNNVKVWSQEFRFTNPATYQGPWNWTAGAYLFHQNNPVRQATNFGADAAYFGAEPNTAIINTSTERADGQALFGQLNYALHERLLLVGGLRFDHERRYLQVRGDYEIPAYGLSVPYRSDTSATKDFMAASPKLGLDYRLGAENHIYVSVSKGFRAGGLTPLSGDPAQPPLSQFKPEYSTSWEAGSKNKLAGGKWILNLSVFHSLIRDIQVPTLVLPEAITVIRNTGKLTSTGFEIEGSLVPVNHILVDYSFGLTRARYQILKLPSRLGDDAVVEIDYKGNRQLFTPDRTGLLALQYTIDLDRKKNAQLWLRGAWNHVGTVYFDLANSLRQKPVNLFSANIGVEFHRLELSIWGRNIFGEKYVAYAYDFGAVHLGDPATWGIRLKKKFGK